MDHLIRRGRIFFAIGIAFFGVEYLYFGRFLGGLPPMPPWTPGAPLTAYLTGVALIVAAVGIAFNRKARLAATLLGILFFLSVLILHGPHFSAILHNGNDRTRALEPLALCAAAWVLAGSFTNERSAAVGWEALTNGLAFAGRFIFALTMIIFGIQHFMYAPFIAFLVPSWLPAHLFWAYFTGTGFIVAGLAIIVDIWARLAATWLGIMFLLWFVFLHAPRVAAALHNADEWTSAFVALAMGGASFIIADAVRRESSRGNKPPQ